MTAPAVVPFAGAKATMARSGPLYTYLCRYLIDLLKGVVAGGNFSHSGCQVTPPTTPINRDNLLDRCTVFNVDMRLVLERQRFVVGDDPAVVNFPLCPARFPGFTFQLDRDSGLVSIITAPVDRIAILGVQSGIVEVFRIFLLTGLCEREGRER